MIEKITLHVEGMTCGHCEIAVKDAVRKLPGVKKVKASKRKKEAEVEFDEASVTQEQIVEAISDTGYRVIL